MLINELKKAVQSEYNGACDHRQHIENFLPAIVSGHRGGNLLEIGIGHGASTFFMLDIANQYSRKLIAVDPWIDEGYTKESFLKICEDFNTENLVLLSEYSQRHETQEKILTYAPYAFAFLDGDMTEDGMFSDIMLAAEARTWIVCIDDYNFPGRWKEIQGAVKKFLLANDEYDCVSGRTHDAFLIRRSQ